MLTVLDLDLDFFVWPVVRGPVEGRPSDSDLACASPEQVRLFLEEQCGLSRENESMATAGELPAMSRTATVSGRSNLTLRSRHWPSMVMPRSSTSARMTMTTTLSPAISSAC